MGLDQFVQIDVVLPAQVLARRRRQAPELRLMIAVLQDALECLQKERDAASKPDLTLSFEARQWFQAAEADWPYSFESICGVLDLDPNAVRQQLGVAPAGPTPLAP